MLDDCVCNELQLMGRVPSHDLEDVIGGVCPAVRWMSLTTMSWDASRLNNDPRYRFLHWAVLERQVAMTTAVESAMKDSRLDLATFRDGLKIQIVSSDTCKSHFFRNSRLR